MRRSWVRVPPGGRTADPLVLIALDTVNLVEEKRCSRCGLTKPLDHFHRNRRRRDGRGTYCAPCVSRYNAEYYPKNSERHNPARIQRRQRERDEQARKLIEYLLKHPCVDCGETDVLVLQFDHLGDKTANVSFLVGKGVSWSRVEREMEKCDVVCANDHRRRTAHRSGWRKLLSERAELPS